MVCETKGLFMETATQTQTRTLEIDGMSGDACVKKVTGALKAVANVETKSVSVGSATIKSDKACCNAACAAIKEAGFSAHEGVRTGHDSSEPARDSNDKQQHGKGQAQPSMPLPDSSTASAPSKTGGNQPGQVVTPGATPKPAYK